MSYRIMKTYVVSVTRSFDVIVCTDKDPIEVVENMTPGQLNDHETQQTAFGCVVVSESPTTYGKGEPR